ncbi:hypothetical protein Q4493_09585 [Colwellia sp. 1_MG-2023]|uniref:hypothetical protein n=1 Tax=Colwellia sp. 1_MG-2023 TaxID=3062649 RepID=UPI0026E381B3|nr:hypothetical protein [Colwellia sp. 1_MG-2023]MDO6446023.1 hypothetical protein [Colwellia sp. 1_MG-2023]
MFKPAQGLLLLLMFLLVACMPNKEQRDIYVVPQCIASQSQCQINIAQARYDILFNVKSVTPEQPFSIIVKSKSLDGNVLISGYLEGKEMYMGKIPLFFEKDEAGNFVAPTMLGSCAEKEMIWRMWLIISDEKHPSKTQPVFIDFTSYRH